MDYQSILLALRGIMKQSLNIAKENFCWQLENAFFEWTQKRCENLNLMNGKTFCNTLKKLFCNQFQPRVGVFLNQESLITDASSEVKVLFRDFFSGQQLGSGSFNEQSHQDVIDQVNYFIFHRDNGTRHGQSFERVEHQWMISQPRQTAPIARKKMGPYMIELSMNLLNGVLEDRVQVIGTNCKYLFIYFKKLQQASQLLGRYLICKRHIQ